MADPFAKIHRLLRAGMHSEALRLIYDRERYALRTPYDGDPNHGWYVVGDILFKKGRFLDSAYAFQLSVESDPDDPQAHMALANAHSAAGDPTKAETSLRAALYLDPANPEILFNLGNALFDQEKYSECVSVYREIGKNDPTLYTQAQKNLKLAGDRMKHKRL